MFTPLYLLPNHTDDMRAKAKDRWQTPRGQEIRERVIDMIRNGAGEDFLQWNYEEESWSDFLEDMWDLKGIDIGGQDITFPTADNFESIDFSWSSFASCTFRNATFLQAYFGFSKFYNCKFVNCTFLTTVFFGAEIEDSSFVGCDFISDNRFENCDFVNSRFEDWFARRRLLFDCKFNNASQVLAFRSKPNTSTVHLEDIDRADLIYGIEEAYRAGGVERQARSRHFQRKQCITRHNEQGFGYLSGLFLELVTGYGVYPYRVLLSMLIVFSIWTGIFTVVGGIPLMHAFVLSAGAFFTFGGNADRLNQLPFPLMLAYVAECFIGISLMALLITVLARLWFTGE